MRSAFEDIVPVVRERRATESSVDDNGPAGRALHPDSSDQEMTSYGYSDMTAGNLKVFHQVAVDRYGVRLERVPRRVERQADR
jgi:hypothetical protein